MLLFIPFASRTGAILFGWVSGNIIVPSAVWQFMDDSAVTFMNDDPAEFWNV